MLGCSRALAMEHPAATELRHRLHADPRLSGDEADTADTVVEALPEGQVDVLAGTGRWVSFGGDGPAIGLRGSRLMSTDCPQAKLDRRLG